MLSEPAILLRTVYILNPIYHINYRHLKAPVSTRWDTNIHKSHYIGRQNEKKDGKNKSNICESLLSRIVQSQDCRPLVHKVSREKCLNWDHEVSVQWLDQREGAFCSKKDASDGGFMLNIYLNKRRMRRLTYEKCLC